MPDQRDVQQLIQSLTPSAVNNGNPNTVYNQPMPQGGYIPPTFDPGTNTWRVNPAPAPSNVNWQQMSASQPQSWGWQGPAQPAPPTTGTPPPVVAPPVTTTPIPSTPVPTPTPPVVNQPMTPEETAGFPGDGSWDLANHSGRDDPSLRWKQQPMIMQAPVGPNDVGYLFQSPVQYPDRNSGGSSQLGQGIYDAYGGAPSGATNNSGYMDAAWGGVGNSNVDTWDTSWMQNNSPAGSSNIPMMPPVQAQPEQQGFWGNLWDNVKGGLLTVADAVIPGNLYHSDTGEVAPWQAWVTSAADSALGTGGAAQQAWEAYGKGGLKDGYNAESSAERTAIGNLQYQYQQASPQKRAAMLQSMTKPGSGYTQEVIDAITGDSSHWQSTR